MTITKTFTTEELMDLGKYGEFLKLRNLETGTYHGPGSHKWELTDDEQTTLKLKQP
jgi:hypothetical protein